MTPDQYLEEPDDADTDEYADILQTQFEDQSDDWRKSHGIRE